jgi:hypothetical protein
MGFLASLFLLYCPKLWDATSQTSSALKSTSAAFGNVQAGGEREVFVLT